MSHGNNLQPTQNSPPLSAPALANLLLGKDDEAEERRWQGLEEAQLDKEITIYRQGVRALSSRLEAEGIPVSISVPCATTKSGGQDPSGEVWVAFTDPNIIPDEEEFYAAENVKVMNKLWRIFLVRLSHQEKRSSFLM